MALPYLKETFYLPFYFQQIQWRPCTVLNFAFAHHRHSQQFIKSHGKGVKRRGQLSRVNGTIKMQQALNIQINAKNDPLPNLLFFLQNCGQRKAATDPRTQVQQLPSNKSGSTSRLESVISSLLVVLMRIFFKETNCIVPPGS